MKDCLEVCKKSILHTVCSGTKDVRYLYKQRREDVTCGEAFISSVVRAMQSRPCGVGTSREGLWRAP